MWSVRLVFIGFSVDCKHFWGPNIDYIGNNILGVVSVLRNLKEIFPKDYIRVVPFLKIFHSLSLYELTLQAMGNKFPMTFIVL